MKKGLSAAAAVTAAAAAAAAASAGLKCTEVEQHLMGIVFPVSRVNLAKRLASSPPPAHSGLFEHINHLRELADLPVRRGKNVPIASNRSTAYGMPTHTTE